MIYTHTHTLICNIILALRLLRLFHTYKGFYSPLFSVMWLKTAVVQTWYRHKCVWVCVFLEVSDNNKWWGDALWYQPPLKCELVFPCCWLLKGQRCLGSVFLFRDHAGDETFSYFHCWCFAACSFMVSEKSLDVLLLASIGFKKELVLLFVWVCTICIQNLRMLSHHRQWN